MEDKVIDVEYKEVVDLEKETNEQLAGEANTLWSQMEAIGAVGMQMAAEAGRRLTIIKGRLEHGEWEDWAKENLRFSLRKANRMMLLAEKMNNEVSIFSNPSILADIGISKVWSLLGAPEEVAEEVVSEPGATDMTVKEFEEEIKRLKAEKVRLEINKEITLAKKHNDPKTARVFGWALDIIEGGYFHDDNN